MTVFYGRHARIYDTAHRPFVVNIKELRHSPQYGQTLARDSKSGLMSVGRGDGKLFASKAVKGDGRWEFTTQDSRMLRKAAEKSSLDHW